ncbi:hypothetical protein BDFB_011178 [Asbolus verrucosus]|uniref:Uncharacterized protein n=1 Tax=Asbolus verrucosus TaxID=1661398 RepID=A0A482VVB9_ASBVE|nr:hypothetical protein BDFB_011178 [Asbolus verrucosus]
MVGHVSDYTLFSSHTIYCDRHKSLNRGDSSASLYEVRRARPLTHSQTFQIETPIIYKFLTRPDGFSIHTTPPPPEPDTCAVRTPETFSQEADVAESDRAGPAPGITRCFSRNIM